MVWIILVSIGTLFYAITTIMQRTFLKDEKSNSFVYTIIFLLSVAFLSFIYTLITGLHIPLLTPLIPALCLMTVLYALGSVALYEGLRITEASQTAILSSSKPIWTVLTAAIFLGEPVTSFRVIGLILVVLGVIIISWTRSRQKFNKGHVFILASAALYGCAFTNTAFLLKSFEAPTFAVISFALPGIALLAIRPKSIKEMKFFFDKKHIVKMLLASFLYAIATITLYLSYRTGGDASQIMPISQFSSILVVILAYFFLKEKDFIFRKVIGSILALVGVILLVS